MSVYGRDVVSRLLPPQLFLRHIPATALPMTIDSAAARRTYHPFVVDHFERPRNVGKFETHEVGPNEVVTTGLVGSMACGDCLRIQLKIDTTTRTVVDAKFKTFGCGSAIASSSYSTELVKGKTVDEAAGIKNSEISKHLSLPPVKLHCSLLAEDAIKENIRRFHRGKSGGTDGQTAEPGHATTS